jgi:acyl-coenzyme A synthetase/AMP-(fatty) acid ligase
VNVFEVKEEILRHPDVITAAAIAVPSQLGDGTEDDIKVVVVVREGSQARGFNEEGLWEWCGNNMARFQVPAVIEFVRELKRALTGKVE